MRFTASAEAELERLWLLQLNREHKEISSYYNVPLKTPVIMLDDLKSRWGQWDPLLKAITLSRTLIKEHSWDVVLEVLKHEMAHQYVGECLRLHDEVHLHGEPFKDACRRLGVAPWAARATGEIPAKIPTLRERVLSHDDAKLLERVEKLLSLAQSSNEHEALLAMERVREIYAKHNIQKIRQSVSEDSMDSLFLTKKKRKTDAVESKILSILNDHFRVTVIYTQLFDAGTCKPYKAAEILGRRENIIMAEFVYSFLNQQCDSLWRDYLRKHRCPGNLRRSYQLGILSGFDEKLSKNKDLDRKVASNEGLNEQETTALLRIETSEISRYVNLRYPRIRTRSASGTMLDYNAYSSGKSDGRNLNLSRPMSSSSGRLGGYLT